MKKGILIILVLSMASVGVWYLLKTTSSKSSNEITLLYQSYRAGYLEPCGCQKNPHGGIYREANAVKKIREENPNVLYVDAGNLLTEQPIKDIKSEKEKALELMKMLEIMGLDVFAPGENDYKLGLDFLKEVKSLSSASFVSTNVVDEDLKHPFEPYVIKKAGQYNVAFISMLPEVEDLDLGKLKVISPRVAIERIREEVQAKADLIVLLSGYSATETEKLIKDQVSIAQVVVSSDYGISTPEALWQQKGQVLLVDPYRYGYHLGKLQIDLKLPFKGFTSESAIAENQVTLKNYQKSYEENPVDLEVIELMTNFERNAQLETIDGASEYNNEMIHLDKERFGQSNEVEEMLKAHYEMVRQRALAE